jgi:prolyl-tRNA synthetase
VDTYEDFKEKVKKWFVLAHRDGTPATAEKIQNECSTTIRCLPFDQPDEQWKCVVTGNPSKRRVLFARSY